MRKLWIAILIFLDVSAFASPARSYDWLIEAAPIQGAVGQLSLRLEKKWQDRLFLGIGLDQKSFHGDRNDKRDQAFRLQTEVVWQPQLDPLPGSFWFAGFAVERVQTARRQERDYLTGIKYTENERWDLWVNEDLYASVPIGVGYRWRFGSMVTAAIRFENDMLLMKTSSNDQEKIYSPSVDMTSRSRPAHVQHLIFYAGVSFD